MQNPSAATSSSHRRGKSPSFSSVLLDSIYRSIDLDTSTTPSSPTHDHHQPTPIICNEHFSPPSIIMSQAAHNQRRTQQQHKTASRTANSTPTTTKSPEAGRDTSVFPSEKPAVNLKRAIMIEHWMEKYQLRQENQVRLAKIAENHRHHHDHDDHHNVATTTNSTKIDMLRQKSVPSRSRRHNIVATGTRTKASHYRGSSIPTSTSTRPMTSSSSLLEPFSAEAGSYSCFSTPQIPLKIRTTFSSTPRWEKTTTCSSSTPHPKNSSSEAKFMARTKSRALKIYGELKNANRRQQNRHLQAVSPGAKIASFLSSVFAANNKKKNPQRKTGSSDSEVIRSGRKPNNNKDSLSPAATTSSSSCSSGSSFSRSCLSSKTTSGSVLGSSRGDGAKTSKRSVRFDVVIDEEDRLRFCNGHRWSEDSENIVDPKQIRIRSIFDSMVVKSAQMGVEAIELETEPEEEEDEEIDGDIGDDESCASSDLFELENLNSVGLGLGLGVERTMAMCGRHVDNDDAELPVYGTTTVDHI